MKVTHLARQEERDTLAILGVASPSHNLHGTDIALICVFAVLLCFTFSYLVFWKDPKTHRRSRVFHYFQDIFAPRRSNLSTTRPTRSSGYWRKDAESTLGSDAHLSDISDVEKKALEWRQSTYKPNLKDGRWHRLMKWPSRRAASEAKTIILPIADNRGASALNVSPSKKSQSPTPIQPLPPVYFRS